ncbi:alpha/beta hydrolase [Izhakiella australiensis]|uniref:Alpha/beta hydrolase n=1 Tax=Izhakiella australiensis TaxID=1926881 RepID=A0A1S8YT41_9GAMM|nr:alpha/beta hydrolase [Izhakiella australiensis]OON42006.1 alpha/beta hydrolase [Izhakiella australiensis]
MSRTTELFSEAFTIPAATAGIELNLRHRRPQGQTRFDASRTIMMMHGATYSSGSLFDTPLEGASFIDWLAAAGFDVWALDVRGYGASTRPAAMLAPAADNAPAVGTEIAVSDLSCAIEYVLQRQGLTQLNIIGMSWGGSVTGSYTSRHPDKVRRLGLIAPQWLTSGRAPLDPGGELGAWRIIEVNAMEKRWLSGAPQHKRATLIPPGGFAAWKAQTLSEEPDEALRRQDMMRASNGPVQDTRDYWTVDRPFYDPAAITVPLLLLHGEWDVDVPVSLAQAWFLRATGAPWKRWIEIGEATHMMVLEKNRVQVYQALSDFFLSDLSH